MTAVPQENLVTRTNERRDEELVMAMTILSPKTLFSWLTIHFLGYATEPTEKEESLDKLFARMVRVKNRVSSERSSIYEQFLSTARDQPDPPEFSEEFVRETDVLLSSFEMFRRPQSQNVVVGERGIVLTDISYYRRKLVRRLVTFK